MLHYPMHFTFSKLLRMQSFLQSRMAVACVLACLVMLLASCSSSTSGIVAPTTLPTPNHIVIVIEENHSFNDIIGSSSAPYINSLTSTGAVFTQSFAVTHPSQPNYLALFSGSTQGISDDSCPHAFSAPDLGGELIQASRTFGGYSEDLLTTGSGTCETNNYARKHNPWVNFSDVPADDNMLLTSFPSDFSLLPTVSIVVPNLQNDMHDGTVAQGDTWLQQHLAGYVQWAKTNNSLFVLTWDEDDNSQNNQIPTIFVGSMVKAGSYNERINHYSVLRTLEDMYNLSATNNSANVSAISDCWQATSLPTPTPSAR